MSEKKKVVHYVNNKALYEAMKVFIAQCKEAKAAGEPRPKIPEYIGVCIFEIATRLANKHNYSSYSYREEMISDGYENVVTYIHSFNPEKSNNPFAYFTTIINYAFIRRIEKEKKQSYIKNKMLDRTLILDSNMSEEDMPIYTGTDDYMNTNTSKVDKKARNGAMYDSIQNFEDKEKEKKIRRKNAKAVPAAAAKKPKVKQALLADIHQPSLKPVRAPRKKKNVKG